MPGYCKADAEILKQFGAALGAKREALHISQEKLAERAGLHRTYYWRCRTRTQESGPSEYCKDCHGPWRKSRGIFY